MQNNTAPDPDFQVGLNENPIGPAATVRNWVLALLALGYWAHLTHPKQKRPIGERWGLDRWDQNRVDSAFKYRPKAGVGIALGPGRAPGGGYLIDLEGDGPEAHESLLKIMGGEIPQTPSWDSARGGHALFDAGDGVRLQESLIAVGAEEGTGEAGKGAWHIAELPGLEWRIGGYKPDGSVKQVQSICPPTLGTDGKPRRWIIPPDFSVAKLPESVFAVLEALAEERAKKQAPTAKTNSKTTGRLVAKTPATSPDEEDPHADLDNSVSTLAAKTSGERHDYLLGFTLRMAAWVKGEELTEQEVISGLNSAARSNGMEREGRMAEIAEAWRSAMVMAKPRKKRRVANSGTPSPSSNGNGQYESRGVNGAGVNTATDWTAYDDASIGIISADSVVMEAVKWLWRYRLAAGEFALLAGDGGLGKSSLLLAIAAHITLGAEWWDKSGLAPVGDVIIVSAEDSRESTLKPRLVALGADLSKIAFVTAKLTIPGKDGAPPTVNPMSLQALGYWREILRRRPECKLLIIDPIPSYLGRGVNDAKNAELRAVLEPFLDLVTRPSNVCLIANTHLNKSPDARTPLHRVTGSTGYGALPRNVHFVVRDPEDSDRRLFKQAKCNNAPDGLDAIAYRMITAVIPGPNGEIETAFPLFEAEPVKVDLADAMSAVKGKRGPAPEKTTKVAEWLLEYLAETMNGEWTPLRQVFDAAGALGFVGVQKPDKSGRLKWSIPTALYDGRKIIPTLPDPNDGWIIEDRKNGRSVDWRAVQ
jgi:energy-coupling factor transporter ATP-binding protein EcfA2